MSVTVSPKSHLTLMPIASFSLTLIAASRFNDAGDLFWLYGSMIGLLGCLASLGALRNRAFPFSGLSMILIGELLWLAILPAFSVIPYLSIPSSLVLAATPLACLLGWAGREDASFLILAERTLTALAVAIFGLALIEFVIMRSRPYSFFYDPNVLAAFANAFFFVAYGRLIARWTSHGSQAALRSPAAGLAALALITGFTTTSLGGFLCFAGGLGLMTVIGARRNPVFWKAAALTVLLAGLSYAVVYASVQGRPSPISRIAVEAQTGGKAGFSEGTFIRERSAIYASTLAMIRDQPWYGSGPGTYKPLYPRYRSPDDQSSSGDLAHNDYLQFRLEGGVPLLLCLLGLLAAVVMAVGGSARRFWTAGASQAPYAIERLGIQIGLLTVFLHAVPNFIFYSLTLSLLVGLLLSQMTEAPTKALDLSGGLTPALRRLLFGLAFLLLTVTIGLPALFTRIQSGTCGLRICENLARDPVAMARFATALTALQPSWTPGINLLVDGQLALAGIASDDAQRKIHAAEAVRISSRLLQRYPAIYTQYQVLADTLEAHPDTATFVAAGVPRDPMTLYQLASRANPIYTYARVRLASYQSQAGDDAAAWATIFEGTRWWKLNIVSDGDRKLLLDTALPLAVRTRHCVDAREMADGLLLLDRQHAYAKQVLAAIPEADAASSVRDNCGLPEMPALPVTGRAPVTVTPAVTSSAVSSAS